MSAGRKTFKNRGSSVRAAYDPDMDAGLEEVRRERDGELCGFIRRRGDHFDALTVFHGVISSKSTAQDARRVVRERGLTALAEHWFWWSRATRSWSVVVPQEAHPGSVRVAVGYYALPGGEVETITAEDLAQGDILTLERPDAPVEGYPE